MTTPTTTPSTTDTTTQVYRIFIRSTPEKIWEAIVNPEFTQRYFHGAHHRDAGRVPLDRTPW